MGCSGSLAVPCRKDEWIVFSFLKAVSWSVFSNGSFTEAAQQKAKGEVRSLRSVNRYSNDRIVEDAERAVQEAQQWKQCERMES